jgi:hypothetical protein
VEQLPSMTRSEVLAICNYGETTIREIERALAEPG